MTPTWHVAATDRRDDQKVTYQDLRGLGVQDAELRIEPFLTWLHERMPEGRANSAEGFSSCEVWIWARHFPDEVPLINGEYAWIALSAP